MDTTLLLIALALLICDAFLVFLSRLFFDELKQLSVLVRENRSIETNDFYLLKKMFYNARKRDENLLREVHKLDRNLNYVYVSLTREVDGLNGELRALRRTASTLLSNTGKVANDYSNTKSQLNKIDKNGRESLRILSVFEETVKKSNKK